jgi:hypothetical protein
MEFSRPLRLLFGRMRNEIAQRARYVDYLSRCELGWKNLNTQSGIAARCPVGSGLELLWMAVENHAGLAFAAEGMLRTNQEQRRSTDMRRQWVCCG